MSLINDALKRASQVEKLRPIPRPAGPALQPAASHDDAPMISRSVLLGLAVSLTLLLAGWFLWQWFEGVPGKKTSGTSLATTPSRGAEKAAEKTATPTAAAKTTVEKTLASAGDSAKSSLVNLTGAAKSAAATLTAAVARQAETPPAKPGAHAVEKFSVPPHAAPHATAASVEHASAAPPAGAPQIPPAIMASIAKSAPETEVAPRLLDPVAPAPPPFPVLRLQGVIYRSANASAFINGRILTVGDKVEDAVLAKIERQSVTFEMSGQTKVVQLAR